MCLSLMEKAHEKVLGLHQPLWEPCEFGATQSPYPHTQLGFPQLCLSALSPIPSPLPEGSSHPHCAHLLLPMLNLPQLCFASFLR